MSITLQRSTVSIRPYSINQIIVSCSDRAGFVEHLTVATRAC
jgi:hypothetical protein